MDPQLLRGMFLGMPLGRAILLLLLDLLFTEGLCVHPSLATPILNKESLRHNGVQLDKLWEVGSDTHHTLCRSIFLYCIRALTDAAFVSPVLCVVTPWVVHMPLPVLPTCRTSSSGCRCRRGGVHTTRTAWRCCAACSCASASPSSCPPTRARLLRCRRRHDQHPSPPRGAAIWPSRPTDSSWPSCPRRTATWRGGRPHSAGVCSMSCATSIRRAQLWWHCHTTTRHPHMHAQAGCSAMPAHLLLTCCLPCVWCCGY